MDKKLFILCVVSVFFMISINCGAATVGTWCRGKWSAEVWAYRDVGFQNVSNLYYEVWADGTIFEKKRVPYCKRFSGSQWCVLDFFDGYAKHIQNPQLYVRVQVNNDWSQWFACPQQ